MDPKEFLIRYKDSQISNIKISRLDSEKNKNNV